jgi:serine/threonine protein kinase
MLCGIPPFYHENIERMYELIKLSELRFPKKVKISAEVQDLIAKFLDRNPQTRLGSKDGLKEFKNHPFFSKIDFDKVIQKKLIPTFKPEVSGNIDVRNFDEEFTGEAVEQQSVIPDSNLDMIRKNKDRFKDF